MKFFGAVIVFLIAFMVLIAMIAILYLRKLYIRIRQHITGDYDEETVRRMSEKFYNGDGEGPKFDKDYFKGTGSSRQYRGNGQQAQRPKQEKRTMTTDDGVTIIDQRSRETTKRKIFTKDEGEYVDFVEEA